MTAYTFRITHKDAGIDDETTLDLPDLHAAWEEATITAGHMLKDMDGSLKPKTEWAIQVVDDRGNPIRTIRVVTEAHKERRYDPLFIIGCARFQTDSRSLARP